MPLGCKEKKNGIYVNATKVAVNELVAYENELA